MGDAQAVATKDDYIWVIPLPSGDDSTSARTCDNAEVVTVFDAVVSEPSEGEDDGWLDIWGARSAGAFS